MEGGRLGKPARPRAALKHIIAQLSYVQQNSALDPLRVGDKQRYAILTRFDLSAIPASATVIQASLQLYAVGWGGTDMSIEAFYITRTTTIDQATWMQARTGDNWGIAGGKDVTSDRRPAPESTVTTSGPGKWYPFDLTAVAQGWVSGALPNNGILLGGSSPVSSSSFYFASVETGTPASRPKLVITYRTGP